MKLHDRIAATLLEAAARIALDVAAESRTPSPVALAIAERCVRERSRILTREPTPAPVRDALVN